MHELKLNFYLICHKVKKIFGIESVSCHSVGPKTIVLELYLYSWLTVIPFKRFCFVSLTT